MTRIEKLIIKIKEEILGKQYELSFCFISKDKIKELNKTHRQKNEPTDILSFPLEKWSGEILICKEMVKEKAPKFGMSYNNYLLFLIIHGMLHLKGYDHGPKMEKKEKFYFEKFGH